MLDLSLVRNRLLSQASNPLRDISITANVEEAMRETVQAPRAMLMHLGEAFGRNAAASAQVSHMVQVEFGVLLAVPDLGRRDEKGVLNAPRAFVRRALLGWAPDEDNGLTAIECRRGQLMAAGPVLWWLDTFATEYIATGAGA